MHQQHQCLAFSNNVTLVTHKKSDKQVTNKDKEKQTISQKSIRNGSTAKKKTEDKL